MSNPDIACPTPFMHLSAFGISHHTAPLDLRSRFVFDVERAREAVREVLDRRIAREAALLSTCNRTEIYLASDDPDGARRASLDWLAGSRSLAARELEPHTYHLGHEQAVRHVFRVAAGLDSMVIGEPQILGQLKRAAQSAADAGAMGTYLHQLFQKSFSTAKEVRSRTAIGAQSVSLAAAAVRQAERIFPSLAEAHVLMIGAGEMIELAATHFAERRPRSLTFANRSPERSAALAERFGAQVLALPDLGDALARYDVVVSCTASVLPIIGKGMIERALKARRRRPVFMVDLAVPRDIEIEAGELPDVYLNSLDDLGRAAAEGRDARQAAVGEAEAIVDARVEGFMQWLAARKTAPLVKRLRAQAEDVRRAEVERALAAIRGGREVTEVLEQLSAALTNKLMHAPTAALAAAARSPEVPELVRSLYRI